jgi:hypothetical protein
LGQAERPRSLWIPFSLWEEYCERYERVSEESEAFSRIFGEEFAQAGREPGLHSRAIIAIVLKL